MPTVSIDVTLEELKIIIARRSAAFAALANSDADADALKTAYASVADIAPMLGKLSNG